MSISMVKLESAAQQHTLMTRWQVETTSTSRCVITRSNIIRCCIYDTAVTKVEHGSYFRRHSSPSRVSCKVSVMFWRRKRRYNGTWTIIDPSHPSHKSYNAPVPYPTMHHLLTEMCTCKFLSHNGALWDMGRVHCEIFARGLGLLIFVSDI